MTHEESWNTFIDELRTYVQEHHHFPNKHTNLLSKVKYTRILRQAQEPFFDKITNLLRQAQEPPSTGSGTSFK